jgi:Protein of unknown function (DUF2934)
MTAGAKRRLLVAVRIRGTLPRIKGASSVERRQPREPLQPVLPRHAKLLPPVNATPHIRRIEMPEFQGQKEEKQRELAYELWEKAGRPTGRQDEFWQLAEEQLTKDKRDVPNDDVDAAGEDSFPASDPVNRT